MGGAYTCSSDGVVCADVSYTDVFGQGLINLANAVKGPGYFDANRLTSADFIDNQYVYTIDVQNYDSTWSNNIAQVKSKTENTNADVGLKKQGTGTLVLSGQNTYLGSTIIENGTLQLTGSLAGDVSVSSGIFYLNGGTVSSKIQNTGTVQNNTELKEGLVSGGTLVNQAGGSLYLTSTPDTLVNYGKIILSPSLEDPSVLQQMNVSYLTLAAGGFALDMNNLPEFGEGTSYLVLKAYCFPCCY